MVTSQAVATLSCLDQQCASRPPFLQQRRLPTYLELYLDSKQEKPRQTFDREEACEA